MPNNINDLLKHAQNFAHHLLNPQKLPKSFKIFPKWWNFRHIWPHWLQREGKNFIGDKISEMISRCKIPEHDFGKILNPTVPNRVRALDKLSHHIRRQKYFAYCKRPLLLRQVTNSSLLIVFEKHTLV